MEVITDNNWNEIRPYYKRFNALFPCGITEIKYIINIYELENCKWIADITFANVMDINCARYIGNNPAKFPNLRVIILSGHDLCMDKDLELPSGFNELPKLEELGLEYCRNCEYITGLSNIKKVYFNELSVDMLIRAKNKTWLKNVFPNCCKIKYF